MRVSIKNRAVLWIIVILLLLGFIYLFWQLRSKQLRSEDGYQKQLVSQVDSLLRVDALQAEKLLYKFDSHQTKPNPQDLAYMYVYKMSLLVDRNKTDSIPYFAKKAILYAADLNNDDLQSKLNYNLGKYYRLIGDYPNSLRYSLKGVSLKQNNEASLIDLYNNLGGIYFELTELDKSIEYFKKSYEVATKLKDSKRIAVAEGNLGGTYLIKEDYDNAKAFLQRSKAYFEDRKDTLNIIKLSTTLSKLELMKNNFSEADAYLNYAKQLSLQTNDKVMLGLVYQHYGNFYLKQKNFELSKEYYSKALGISKEKKIPRDNLNALFGLRDASLAQSDFKQAFTQQTKYYQLRDSLYGEKVRQKMEEIKWASELEEQRIENKLLIGKYEAEQQRKSILTILYLIVIVSVVSFATLLYTNSKKSLRISELNNEKLQERVLAEQQLQEVQEQQFQQELESKNQELIALNILILAKNKIFSEVENIIEKDNSEEVITELKKKVKSNKNQEKDWDKFKAIFEKTHPNFYQTIDDKYPQLSKTEIRICSYIKIAMPKAEICAMMNINHSSLIKTRYRIRKKLNLESNDDLDEFVRSW